MGDNSKELPNAKLHLQEKMREWLGANQEIYSKFKDKIQSVLKDSLRDNVEEQADEEMAAYQNAILEVEVLDKEDGLDNLIDRFMTAIKTGMCSLAVCTATWNWITDLKSWQMSWRNLNCQRMQRT